MWSLLKQTTKNYNH